MSNTLRCRVLFDTGLARRESSLHRCYHTLVDRSRYHRALLVSGFARLKPSRRWCESATSISGFAWRESAVKMSRDLPRGPNRNVMSMREYENQEAKHLWEQDIEGSLYGREEGAFANRRTDKTTFTRRYHGPELEGGNKHPTTSTGMPKECRPQDHQKKGSSLRSAKRSHRAQWA